MCNIILSSHSTRETDKKNDEDGQGWWIYRCGQGKFGIKIY